MNRKINFALFLIYNLIFLDPVSAQTIEPDYLHVHLDKVFYVTGERINFKVYFLNQDLSPSSIVHTALVNQTGDIINEKVLKVENNATFGAVDIPLDLPDGIYFLKIYTVWNFNFNPDFNLIRAIPIYNDFGTDTYNPIENNQEPQIPGYIDNYDGNLEIEILNNDPIRTRDLISLKTHIGNYKSGSFPGSLSISVTDLDKCGSLDPIIIHERYEHLTSRHHSYDSIFYSPEKEIKIQGVVTYPDSGKPVNSNLLSVYQLNKSGFERLKTKEGSFSISITPFEGLTDIQIINMNPFQPAEVKVRLKHASGLVNIPDEDILHFKKDQQVEKYLYYSKMRRKINEIFRDNQIDSIAFPESDFPPFEPDKTLIAEKYHMLKNTEEFIREAVLNTSHITENEKRKILLYNQETKKFFMRSPWILVDNYIILDDSLAYNIPFNQLLRVDIFNRDQSILKYFDPIMIQGGVIAIYSKNNYLENHISQLANTVTINGLTAYSIVKPGYPGSNSSTLHKKPDLDPVIYWDPDIRCDKNGIAEIEFFSNDISGYYQITIDGFDGSGRPVSGSRVIKVHP